MKIVDLPLEEGDEHPGVEMVMEEKDTHPGCHQPVIFVRHVMEGEDHPYYYLIPLEEKENFEKACKERDDNHDSKLIDRFVRWAVDGLTSLRVQLFVDDSQYGFEYCEEGD